MLPDIWGKHAWNFLHLVTMAYPENPTQYDKEKYHNFFDSIKYILPCEKCRNNMGSHLKKYPLTETVLSSRKMLVKWLIDLHNVVNYYTGKDMLSYNEALSEMKKLTNPTNDKTDYFVMGIFLIAVIIVIFWIYYFASAKNLSR